MTALPARRVRRRPISAWRRRLREIDWGFWLLLASMVAAASSPFVAGAGLRFAVALPLYWLGYEDQAMKFALNAHW
ncbi:hypothetical protein [Ferrovibrio xuzhouensis]|uniref:Uncharacterized protein n=1 Tax=Ferrovibrio xuzhouensis TaxID=1576914 RepID=A0ABV7VEA2_9PROT